MFVCFSGHMAMSVTLQSDDNAISLYCCQGTTGYKTPSGNNFLARLHEVHRAIVVTPVVHVPVPVCVPVRVTLALKFSRSPYLDNHSSESIHTWTIDTL